jgi:hypothetical protein
MTTLRVGFYAGLFLAIAIFCIPVWLLAKAIVYRLTKSDDRPVLTNAASVVIAGTLAALWGSFHASMFADANSQPLPAELIFVVIAGSAALFAVHLFGLFLIGSYGALLSGIRGK